VIALLAMMLVKVTVVLTLALAAMPLLRRRSAALRHWVLGVALACAAALPVLTLVAPAWELPSSGLVSTSLARYTVESELVILGLDSGSGANAVPSPATSSGGIRLEHVLVAIWLSGVLLNLGSLFAGLARLARLTSRSRDAIGPWIDETVELVDTLRLRRPVQARITHHPALLVTWGVRRPVVLVPSDAVSWTSDRIRAVVSHELAHVQRKDWLTQMSAEVLRACYWFHPLVWVACARLRQESEHACDDVVLRLGIEPQSYAAHLVALARAFKAHGRTWLPAPAVARPSTLQRRIRAMLTTHVDRRPVSSPIRTAIVVAMVCASLSIAGFAAQTTTSLTGTVRDASGRVLADAGVRLADAQTGSNYDTQSDPTGQFQFVAVPPGTYLLSARAMGFSPLVQTVAIPEGGRILREITLQVASLQETISVVGGGPQGSTNRKPRSAPAFTPPSCSPSPVGGQLVPPMKILNVPPDYPQNLQDANVTGKVILVTRIGVDGIVKEVRPFSQSDPGLEDAAMSAVSQWRFTPTLLNCEPIEVQMLATVMFSLTP
jgi:beta-lactamase regulating signal transducer with metallopeptidase domain